MSHSKLSPVKVDVGNKSLDERWKRTRNDEWQVRVGEGWDWTLESAATHGPKVCQISAWVVIMILTELRGYPLVQIIR